jgi:hypothetical protein
VIQLHIRKAAPFHTNRTNGAEIARLRKSIEGRTDSFGPFFSMFGPSFSIFDSDINDGTRSSRTPLLTHVLETTERQNYAESTAASSGSSATS